MKYRKKSTEVKKIMFTIRLPKSHNYERSKHVDLINSKNFPQKTKTIKNKISTPQTTSKPTTTEKNHHRNRPASLVPALSARPRVRGRDARAGFSAVFPTTPWNFPTFSFSGLISSYLAAPPVVRDVRHRAAEAISCHRKTRDVRRARPPFLRPHSSLREHVLELLEHLPPTIHRETSPDACILTVLLY